MKKYPLTEEECLKIGGHCYKRSNLVIDTLPPVYTRYCIHCGHTQRGQTQDSIGWYDK